MTETQHELYKATLNKHMDILLKKNKVIYLKLFLYVEKQFNCYLILTKYVKFFNIHYLF